MVGDKKGKSKMVVQKKKKRTREDCEREQAEALADKVLKAVRRTPSKVGRLDA